MSPQTRREIARDMRAMAWIEDGMTAVVLATAVLLGACVVESPGASERRYDDFDGVDPEPWRVLHPQLADATMENSELRLRPAAMTAWYAGAEAYHHYLVVEGDFAVTSSLRVADPSGGPPLPDWRLGGLMVRDPRPGSVDAYHAALGTVSAQMHEGLVAEVRSTVAGNSEIAFVPYPAGQGELRICRSGTKVRAVVRDGPQSEWILLDEREHPGLPHALAVGPIAYATAPRGDFEAAFDYVEAVPLDAMDGCEGHRPATAETGAESGTTGTDTDTDGTGGTEGDDEGHEGVAQLPPHAPVGVLVISDSANPSGLSDGELTQAGDLAHALEASTSPLHLASLREVSSACVDEALEALASGGVDVLVYFAHQPATRCDGNDAQPQLTAAVEQHLQTRGGAVVFHHGIYEVPGKEAILNLFGGRADRFEWSPGAGQTVVDVAPGHFVTTNGLDYAEAVELGSAALGIAPGTYAGFTNRPDERYPGLRLTPIEGEAREVLFVSDYDGTDILGYDLRRPDWVGHVVLYQPGEYAPVILDPAGPNFQILVNAIYFAATRREA